MKTILFICSTFILVVSSNAHIWPSGGATEIPLTPGRTVTITWDDALASERATIELWDGERSTSKVITSNIQTPLRRFEWTIPFDQPMGSKFRFVLRSSSRPKVAILSQGFIQIHAPYSIVNSVGNETSDQGHVSVYPQPASDGITVSWTMNAASMIEIRDVRGLLMKSQNIHPASSTMEIDVRNIPTGMYTLWVRGADGQKSTRSILIQH
ncbi:MAG: T9SS type A sorting domain-containing protein [Candidatus Kapabacteria bacterium]|nr:T9SS type A sorting domain-containing protein [Candidatus Kapabacteria bacterium]